MAGLAIGLYFLLRGVTDIVSTLFYKSHNRSYVLHIMLLGIGIVSVSYVFLVFIRDAYSALLVFCLMGVGFGIYNPARLSFYSSSLDKGVETKEWGTLDGIDLISLAIASILGGTIFKLFGFTLLLGISAVLAFVSTLPLLAILRRSKQVVADK